jgi:hypothetical protein
VDLAAGKPGIVEVGCVTGELGTTEAERIPDQFRYMTVEVRCDIFILSHRKAQAIHHLQRWVLTPGPFTYTDLIQRLTVDLQLVATGRWHEMPELDYQRYRPRWLVVVQALSGLLVLGAVATAVVLIRRFAPKTASSSILHDGTQLATHPRTVIKEVTRRSASGHIDYKVQ